MNQFSELMDAISKTNPRKIAVAAAADSDVLSAVAMAHGQGIAQPILVGDTAQIRATAKDCGLDISTFEIVQQADPAKAAFVAVELVSSGQADIIMKGLVPSGDFLRAVIDPEVGLRKAGRTISSIGVVEIPGWNRFLLITDPGFIPAPNLETKVALLRNAVEVAQKLGVKTPKVGILCAAETVTPKIPATLDAQLIEEMNRRGEITGCIVAGPISLDLAISAESAQHKGYTHAVAGAADILVMPSIETGNALLKSLIYFSKFNTAGVMAGASAPIVFTSRSDTAQVKLSTIALAVYMAQVAL